MCLRFHGSVYILSSLPPHPLSLVRPTPNPQPPTNQTVNQPTNQQSDLPSNTIIKPTRQNLNKKEMPSYVDKRVCLRSGSSGRHSEVPKAQSADRGGGGSSAQIAEVQGVRQRVARQIDRGALVDARERARGRDGRLRRRHLLPSVAAASGLLRDRRRAGARPAVDDR